MRSFAEPLTAERRSRLGRRSTAVVLALAVELLIALALLSLTYFAPEKREEESDPTVFSITPDPAKQARADRTERAAKAKEQRSGATPAPRAKAPDRPEASEAPAPDAPLDMLILSREDFVSADIGRTGVGKAGEGQGSSTGRDSGAAYGPGEGPGGAALYNAEWYREPTRAEMAFYLPPNVPAGYGLIACKTIENYRVENCRVLSESPPGSGIGRAMRLASWQFLVRPPRQGGRAMVGAWVRIRFDLRVIPAD